MLTPLLLVLSPVPAELSIPQAVAEALHRAEPGVAGTWNLKSPVHGMVGHCTPEGLELDGRDWGADLALEGWGRPGNMRAVDETPPVAEGRRVEYRREGIVEWYVNEARGLEQGFTIEARPAGEGPVLLLLSVDGELTPEVLTGGRDARFLNAAGEAVLHYVGLRAWDADGRELETGLSLHDGGLAIEVLDEGATYPLTVDPWLGTEVAILTADDGVIRDYFGSTTAFSGDTLVVGAEGFGVPGYWGAGAVYILERNQGGPGAWGQVAKLTASAPDFNAAFGRALSIDGDTLVVGAPIADFYTQQIGAAFVFERNQGGPGAWGEVAHLVGNVEPGDHFGQAVAVSGDTIAIGAYGEDGQANDEGAVYLFERNQGTPGAWGLSLRLPSGDPDDKDQFGRALALEDDTLVVGVPNDDFNGTYGLGSAYVFERIAGVWTETQWLSASDGWVYNNFGDSIALDGETLLIGAPGNDHSGITDAGAAYIFERSSGPWTEVRKLTASDPVEDDAFGKVALSGDLALIGAPSNYIAPNLGVGRAYLFARESGGGAWSQVQQLTASDPQNNAQFSRVAIQGNTAAIGAPFQDQGIPIGDVRALAFDSSTQTLYGADSGANQLVSIDLVTGVGTPIGALGFPYVAGMVYHAPSNLLYGVDAPSGDLIRINPTTGKGTVVGPTGFTGLRCLAYDPGPNKLYSFVDQLDLLISISPGTGAGTAVGSLGPLIQGMSFDTATSTLYATDVINDELVTVDTTTAAMTPVGKLGFPNMDGLAFDPIGGTLYGSDRTTGHLFTIDTGSGAATSVGKISTFEYDAGAVYLIALGFETETYCTAGVSASGCQALIEATGVASASASSGFALNISGIEGQKDGLYFYGTNGRQANPWGSGSSYVCVIPPRWRGGLLTGVGTSGSCDGGFSQDLNARWCPTCPKPQHNPGAGALVQAQMWYRDPANTSNQTSSMSDAIEFYVGP